MVVILFCGNSRVIMITKIYKFFQRFWEMLYLPFSLLYDAVNYVVKDAEQEAAKDAWTSSHDAYNIYG